MLARLKESHWHLEKAPEQLREDVLYAPCHAARCGADRCEKQHQDKYNPAWLLPFLHSEQSSTSASASASSWVLKDTEQQQMHIADTHEKDGEAGDGQSNTA